MRPLLRTFARPQVGTFSLDLSATSIDPALAGLAGGTDRKGRQHRDYREKRCYREHPCRMRRWVLFPSSTKSARQALDNDQQYAGAVSSRRVVAHPFGIDWYSVDEISITGRFAGRWMRFAERANLNSKLGGVLRRHHKLLNVMITPT